MWSEPHLRIDLLALLPDPSSLTAGHSIQRLEQRMCFQMPIQEASSPAFGSVKHVLVKDACSRTKATTIEAWCTNKSQCGGFFYITYKWEKEGAIVIYKLPAQFTRTYGQCNNK